MLKNRLVFIGTYTEPILFGTGKILRGKGEGIYAYQLDEVTGQLKFVGINQVGPNPSYLTFHPSRRFMYVVNELKEFKGNPTGAVSAFSIDPMTGELNLLNRVPSFGTDPCYLVVDKTGKFVLVANFASGSVCVLPICEDGSLGEPTDVIQHSGSSIDPVRQAGPHAHAVTLDPSGRFAYVPDLGLDRLMIYKFDSNSGKLEPNDEPWINIPAGSGPRQLVMHPTLMNAYLINELNSTVMAFQCDGERGSLKKIQTLSTLPEEFQGISTGGELQIAPSGKYLYGSNRGHDSIVSYAINQKDGTLSYIGCTPTEGKTPRHFIVDPKGVFLFAANQDTDNVITFKLNSTSGEFNMVGPSTKVPTPVCVKVF